jgi:hypothetical protein
VAARLPMSTLRERERSEDFPFHRTSWP